MTSLYFGLLRDGVPADEKVVRSTTVPYEHDAPPAVMDSQPDRNEFASDPNPHLGMNNRQLASHWIQGVKSAPFWKKRVDDNHLHNDLIDRQVSSSGTAAQREANGEFGHGSLSYAVGIEPVGDLTDGGAMGNEYFVRNERDIQDTSDNTMMSIPPGYDQSTTGRVAATGKKLSREAAQAALYDAFWNEGK
jgi:hypothetical protein